MKQLEMEFSRIGVVNPMQTPKPSPTPERGIGKEETTPAANVLTTPKPKIKGAVHGDTIDSRLLAVF